MGFNVGAALTSAGDIQPALQDARQKEELQRQQQTAFSSQQQTALLNQKLQQSTLDKDAQEKQKWVPVRSYETQTGEKHGVYLTPTGYQDVVETPSRKTFDQYMGEASAVFGGQDKVPDWYKNQALAQSEGLAYKQPTERYNKNVVPDSSSPTGYSATFTDPFSGEEISRVPTLPQRGYEGTETDTSKTDPVTGLTTTGTSVRKPLVSGSTPLGTPPGVAPTLHKLAAPPTSSGGPSSASPAGVAPLDDKGHIPAQKGLPEVVRAAANAIIDSGDEKQVTASPSVKEMARVWVQKYQGTSPSLGTGARQILEKMEPVYAQTQRLMQRIQQLGLKDDDTRGYLLKDRANYALGGAGDPNTLSANIADLSLGSVVEATAALSGSGSRALPALRIALNHTPNPWVDSPKLMYQKLSTINDRLRDVIEEARTGKISGVNPGSNDVVYDDKGVGHRYKGTGNRNDPSSYVAVP